MKNGVLPSLPSQLYIFGNSEVQMPNPDVSMADINKFFSFDPKKFFELGDGGFALPSHSINYQQGSSSSLSIQRLDYPCSGADYQNHMPSSCFDNISQQPMLLGKKQPTVPQFDQACFQGIPNSRKRPIEFKDPCLLEKVSTDVIGKGNNKALNVRKKRKKEAMCFEKQLNHQVKDDPIHIQNYRVQVPVRRSQKLSDKITALQKLVSPYGKTDTASVLQEASVYIKFLHEKIRNMFEVMSSSSSHVNNRPLSQQKIEEKQVDLRSRGLCVVPLSITGKLTREEDQVDHHVVSRNTIMPNNF